MIISAGMRSSITSSFAARFVLKILSFSYCYPNHENPTWGMFVYQRLKALSQKADVQICAPVPWFPFLKKMRSSLSQGESPGPNVSRPGFFYIPGLFKDTDAWFYSRGMNSWLMSSLHMWRPDLLDAHFVWPDGVAVSHLAKEFDLPYTITLRGKLYECLKSSSQTKQCAKAMQDADAVISVSSKMAEEARKLGVESDRLHVIPNGVNRLHFFPRDKMECRRKLGLPEAGRLLVTVAHLGHRKGHHEVIHALANLPEDVRLVIVGGAAQGGTAEKLQAIADQLGVGDRVLLPGPQPYDRIPYYLSAADSSVLASYREGCPNAVLESLACGTPVVATDVGAVPDILPVPDVGRIVPVHQTEPLRAAIAEVLDATWNAEEVLLKSGVRSWDMVAEDVQKVMRKVLVTRKSTSGSQSHEMC